MGETYAESSCGVWGIPEINYAVDGIIREGVPLLGYR
jgi:hypothetical protein